MDNFIAAAPSTVRKDANPPVQSSKEKAEMKRGAGVS